ncbi:hypothetical protein R6L23_25790 [Streptomyces sp. SR27]|uniref:hypothetical protein n=1 Tax=Streptomyces sp. SR27 TaxID=3076630 RepID=UPI00295B4733|nr:hypothetical protein [Streptomyces sp. SR27]MDV9191577.1 hypothetical protein [Streptomyces sp. SR27]
MLTPPPSGTDEETRLRYAASAWLERARVVALLVAAGTSYSGAAQALRTNRETVHSWATVGALSWQRTGDAPEHLVDALASLPPLEPVRRRRRADPDRTLTNT